MADKSAILDVKVMKILDIFTGIMCFQCNIFYADPRDDSGVSRPNVTKIWFFFTLLIKMLIFSLKMKIL